MSEKQSGMFRRIGRAITHFFLPPPSASRMRQVLPYVLLGALTLVFLTAGAYGWEYTNSPAFCGESCHTMPPEYSAYQVSPHARVACVDCHIGQGFIATRITRKAGDVRHVVAQLFTTYEYPIRAGRLRPARETCELCHFPGKFSDDSLRTLVHYGNDEFNTRTATYLALRTGGGSDREGVGRGIHWHIENELWFVATDALQQEIPYIRVINADGTETEYIDIDTDLTAEDYAGMEQVLMDCITCHNRISHTILSPAQAVDRALERGMLDADIPYIRYSAVATLTNMRSSDDPQQELDDLIAYYAREYPEYYAENPDKFDRVMGVLQEIWSDIAFREQRVDWMSHPNNIGHSNWPGCFRCHDGKHISPEGEAVRLECNLCHSIPEVAAPGVLEPSLPLATGLQPESHFSTLWIVQHRDWFDTSCQACHTVENPGGTDNTSFCSNSACHGIAWEYAGFDAPALAELLAATAPPPVVEELVELPLTFDGQIGVLFSLKCIVCHNATMATGGLVLDTLEGALAGGESGPVIVPGNPTSSLLITIQQEGHFSTFNVAELQTVSDWINAGAP
nr:NapC/NirT family cytochrome c [Anaerolineae bacterium]